jgi:hypothetical protein
VAFVGTARAEAAASAVATRAVVTMARKTRIHRIVVRSRSTAAPSPVNCALGAALGLCDP